jgi:putative Holliday junction resolvase
MKYLGIDYGSKRIGLALSDERGDFVYPNKVIENKQGFDEEIARICKAEGVSVIVIGESKDFQMQDNTIMDAVYPFVDRMKTLTGLEVVLHPEFLSSMEAERLQGKNNMLDASAAAIILKSYLDSKK